MVVLTSLGIWTEISIWLTVLIVCVFIEANTVQLTSIWFAIGALVSGILSILSIDFNIQLIVFASISFIMIILTRPLVKKLNKQKTIKTNVEELIGEIVVVTKEIKDGEKGEVKTKYDYYSAVAVDEENGDIYKGTKVKVVDVSGNKVVVERLK